jgi:hypothetical protein
MYIKNGGYVIEKFQSITSDKVSVDFYAAI